jgi:Zn-dependent protease/predicted transcriptional regulator
MSTYNHKWKIVQMFKNALNLIEVFGFRIRIDPSWFLIAALIVWSLTTVYFPEILPGKSNFDYLALSIIAMLGLFISLLIHELSHSLVARIYGIKVKNITLFVFGGVAELEEEIKIPSSEFWIAIAGPISSFALAGMFYLFGQFIISLNASEALQELLSYLSLLNLIVAIFNLVPAFPLDGGRVLRAILWHSSGNFIGATRVASIVGQVFAIFLITTGALAVFTNAGFAGFWQILIGFFIFTASRASYAQVLMSEGLKGKTIENLMSKVVFTADISDTIEELVDSTMLRHGVNFVPVTEGNHLLGYVDKKVVEKIDKDNWGTSKVGDVYVPCDKNNTVTPNLDLSDLIDMMYKTNLRKILVGDDGVLLGVITLSDLLEYLALRNSLHS